MKQFSKDLGNVSLAPKGKWSREQEYERLALVYNACDNLSYVAKINVPSGVDIENREYWQPMNVTGYADNNFINLTTENENGTITAFESLEEAIATILPINRKAGATLSFYNLNSDRLDRQAEFELWQFNSTDLANWENRDYWNNIYYNWNVFVGWYIGADALKNHVKIPTVGQYAYVGSNLNDAILYQCRTNGTWINTGIKVRNYISVVVSGNITIGENGNWFSDGKDTGIPATPAVDEQLDNIGLQLQQHNTEIDKLQKQDVVLKNNIDSNFETINNKIDNIKIATDNKIDTADENLQNQITSNDNDIATLNTKHENLSKTVQGIAATGGASTATNVTYNNDASGLNAENAQDAIDELQGSKFDKKNIKQTLGNSTDKVLSLDALNFALQKKINLYDLAYKQGYINYQGYINSNDTNWVYSDYIPFGADKSFDIRVHAGGPSNIAFYDIDFNSIQLISLNGNKVLEKTIVSPVNTAYIRISVTTNEFNISNNYPTLYIGDAELVRYVIECSRKQKIHAPFKTICLKDCVEKICLYGDSISSSDYDGYKIAMQNLTDVNNVYTAGWSGATTAQLTEDTRLNRVFDYMPDLIIIELGGNDIGDSVGTFGLNPTQTKVAETNIKENYSGTYFIQAVDYIIRKILNKYKKPPYIAVMTPTAQKRKGGENTWNLHRNWVNKRNAVIECCIKNNVHCIDMFNLWGVDMSKEPLWESPTDIVNSKGIYTMDGLHPNKEGFERFAQVITSQVKVENHVNKQFGNSLFTSNKNALGTSTDPLHRTCYMRKVDDNLLGVKFRVGVYDIHVCFCVFDESGSVIDKYSIKASNITQTHTVIFGDDAKAYSVMTLADSFEKSELTEYYKNKKATINESMSNESKGILWLGTSIPEGKVNDISYPIIVGKRLGVNVINKSLGSSFLSTGCYNLNNPMTNLTSKNLDVGKCLTETVEEKENRFREKVNDNTISEDQLNIIKSYSFENLVLPYLDKVDTVVIDHGYNDRLVIQQDLKYEGFDQLDWQSRDKGCFIGAVNFLIDRIKEKYPRMRIILSGHYQNNDDVCRYVCAMQSEIASHFGYPILRLWEYAGMSPQVYVKGTENYISEFNKKYNTSYRPQNANSEGNITELQINCLDNIHPHSDLSGGSINKIGIILTKLIGGIINV